MMCCATAWCKPWWMLGIQWQRGLLSCSAVGCNHCDWSVNRTHPSVTGSFRQHQKCSTWLHSLGESLCKL